jgi:hypothetical protein
MVFRLSNFPRKWNNGILAVGAQRLGLGENTGPQPANYKDITYLIYIVNPVAGERITNAAITIWTCFLRIYIHRKAAEYAENSLLFATDESIELVF